MDPPFIQQTRLVPVDTQSLRFLWKGERLVLRIDGEPVPFLLAEQRLTEDPFVPVHDYYAADLTPYAGREATIRFEFFAHEEHVLPPWPGAIQALDDIYFSPLPIPEPGGSGLLLVGLGWLLVAARRRRPDRRDEEKLQEPT